MAVYVTGDTHGTMDVERLLPQNWSLGKTLTKEDFVIILGDMGLLWEHVPSDKHEIPLTELYNWFPWTTIWLPGNHENYDRIAQLEQIELEGMKVRKHPSWKSIYMLESGLQDIQGTKCFVYRGAESIDRRQRIKGISYWQEEVPSIKEFNELYEEAEHYCIQATVYPESMITPYDKIEFVFSHTCPKDFFWRLIEDQQLDTMKFQDPTMDQLQAFKELFGNYKMRPQYYFGHFHLDYETTEFVTLYEQIRRII
jgi:hypothetical protein